jgi:hypothetical protein
MYAVVTGKVPQDASEIIERVEVRLFDTRDEAIEWAAENPEYVTEVVEVTR